MHVIGLIFGVIMLAISAYIMYELDGSSNFDSTLTSTKQYKNMKNADYVAIIMSIVIVLYCGYQVYSGNKSGGFGVGMD